MEVSGELHAPAVIHQAKEVPVAIGQYAGWAPESIWTPWGTENPVLPAIDPVTSSQ
jgi:hypothetical protein